MEQTTAAEQRAVAVAKLKRAASLPRMKDGRRPPMHVEAVSEGEKAQGEEAQGEDQKEDDGSHMYEESGMGSAEVLLDEPPAAPVMDEEPDQEPEPEAEPESLTVKKKRRSRSRSRSRGSKDLKGKSRAVPSPAPSGAAYANDSSADEAGPLSPSTIPLATPQLISPIPSHFMQLPASHFLRSPNSPFMYPGTSPSTPLPSLEALQRGLFRSNSASATTARMLAMHKLTGGTEPLDSFPSPSPTPPMSSGRLGRNNTVSGGERTAARKRMLHRLGERLKETDAEQTSGGEDFIPASPKRKKRRSRRSASHASAVVDDRDLSSTTPNTPVVPPTALATSADNVPDPPHPSSSSHFQNPSLDDHWDAPTARAAESSTPVQQPRPRRSVVVEEEDDGPDSHFPPPRPTYLGLPSTPSRSRGASRLTHSSDAPSTFSTDSAVGVPVFLSKSVYREDRFPMSPFSTPLKEKASHDEEFQDEEEEEFLYPADSRAGWSSRDANDREISWVADPVPESRPYTDAYDREISWMAEPVPESRMPIHDDDEEEKEDEEEVYDEPLDPENLSPRDDVRHAYSDSRQIVVELETSPEPAPSYMPPSPPSALTLSNSTNSTNQIIGDSTSSSMSPSHSILSGFGHQQTGSLDVQPLEESHHTTNADVTAKRSADGGMWDKIKRPFTRTASTNGRRSRTNSIGTREHRRDHTDSSVSRESGASETDKAENGIFAHQQVQPASVMQSPAASASILSLAHQAPPRGGASPVPPASSADMARYTNAKLFPFPGMKKLEEERNRARGMSASASSPDIFSSPYSQGVFLEQITPSSSSSSTQPARSPELGRDRKLSHQASDTRLLARYHNVASPSISQAPSSSSHTDYFDILPSSPLSQQSNSLKLPMNRKGVKEWLKLFSSQSSSPAPASASPFSPTSINTGSGGTNKKPSLSDLLRGRKDNELPADWEDVGQDKPRTNSNTSTLLGKQSVSSESKEPAHEPAISTEVLHGNSSTAIETIAANGVKRDAQVLSTLSDVQSSSYAHEPPSTTPEPFSSVDEYPTRSTSESSSALSSNAPSSPRDEFHSQGAIVLERLDEMLGRGPRSPMWANATDEPPRKLIQSSAVLQVANSNTVKDRFLFLFNDIIVIAKPIVRDQDVLRDPVMPAALDRRFIVKSVVQLHRLQFNADRDDSPLRGAYDANQQRHPIIKTFVHQFVKDPHHATAALFERLGILDDPVALGQLLFRTLDLDRARLGEYLSQRSSKVVLKAYVDCFGFTGLRVDKALRAFLLSVNVPSRQSQVEYMLDAFASRWYEANAGIVAYDKDLAIRLVRAIVQLNEVLHGGIAQEPGVTGYPRRNVTSRDFMDAFKRTRGLVPDDLLDRIYSSIRRERLCQARGPVPGRPDIPITTKRSLPLRLTYRVQSDPIIVRIPQPDPQLYIHLYGQDLIFEPPILNFAKLSEASFRIIGSSLGPKTIVMCRSGPNALMYSGLPFSSTLMVERSFMRNTFQLAFLNHEGAKRKYMFSIEDPVWRHQWISSLKLHIDAACEAVRSNSEAPGTSRFHRAAESVAFKVLQETLVGPPETNSSPSAPALDRALHRFVSSPMSPRHVPSGDPTSTRQDNPRRNGMYGSHGRSKSRSQIYHRHGAGKMELELSNDNGSDQDGDDDTAVHPRCRLWSSQDLTMTCQKNSSIPLVLSYLQIGSPDTETMRPPPPNAWPVASPG